MRPADAPSTNPNRRFSSTGVALTWGAGLGTVVGLLVAGPPGIALGAALGAGVGVVIGAAIDAGRPASRR